MFFLYTPSTCPLPLLIEGPAGGVVGMCESSPDRERVRGAGLLQRTKLISAGGIIIYKRRHPRYSVLEFGEDHFIMVCIYIFNVQHHPQFLF